MKTAPELYKRLLGGIKPYLGLFALSVVGSAIFAGCQALLARITGLFIGALEGGTPEDVLFFPLAVVAVSLIRGLGQFLGSYCSARVGQNLVRDLRSSMYERMMHLPAQFFDNHNSGSLVSKITYDVTMVTQAVTSAVTNITREGFTVIALLGYMFWIDWKLTLVFLTIGPVLGLLVMWVGRRIRRLSTRIQDAMGDITQVSSETVQGYRIVRSHNAEDDEIARFNQANQSNRTRQLKYELTVALNTPVMHFIIAAALALVMYLVLLITQNDQTHTTEDLITYILLAGLLPKSVRAVGDIYGRIQRGVAAAESIFDIEDQPIEKDEGTLELQQAEGAITISNLTFRYPGVEEPVLHNLNLEIPKGKTVAIVGKSGSGKSTLAALLMRFYDYEQGEIRLDGHALKDITLESLRSQIGVVPQHVTMFNTTIEKNVAYGDAKDATHQQVVEAVKTAHADQFIDQLPEGYETMVGENALKLSGGQRQRLAIARAILRNPPVLILDEATSALDNESEQYIQAAIDKVSENRTLIVIAHRLTTIEKADLIVVLDKGRIVEQGTHEELIQRGGRYAQLHARKFEDS